jgi:hypothetical protein
MLIKRLRTCGAFACLGLAFIAFSTGSLAGVFEVYYGIYRFFAGGFDWRVFYAIPGAFAAGILVSWAFLGAAMALDKDLNLWRPSK